ncbi:MAG: SpoIIE family protein phosphatase [Turicibacter sp.]|nr:SpoIIE family protein phosphatase [Turicibacter sp.]MDO5794648.1 SpoIIE family protein phosphatase [Turicibacter sp.]
MELVTKMKKTFSPKPKRETRDKLNIYTISQLFNQLVNFQQLVKSLRSFIGKGQLIRVDVILDCIGLAIDSMMQSMMYDRHDFELQFNRIKEELARIHVRCSDIKIKSLYPRLIKMDLVINSPPKELTLLSIQAILESITNEPLRLIVEKTKGKQTKIKVYSSNQFKIDHAVSYVGKDGNKISGDSYIYENFTNGQTFIAISDGMGNGELAHKESSEALKILRCLLGFNIPIKTAIQTLQQLKQHSNANERFFSLDICMIDRERQRATFYKKGATPTFLVRNQRIELINLAQLPVGVMSDQEVDHVTLNLEEDDVLLMCSDGIVEQYPNVDELEQVILNQMGKSPKTIAKNILQATVSKHKGKIKDDMMVLVIEYRRQGVVQAQYAS